MPKEKCGTAAENKKATPDRMASKAVKTAKIWWPLLGLNQRPSDYENDVPSFKINKLQLKQKVIKRMLSVVIGGLSSEGAERGRFSPMG